MWSTVSFSICKVLIIFETCSSRGKRHLENLHFFRLFRKHLDVGVYLSVKLIVRTCIYLSDLFKFADFLKLSYVNYGEVSLKDVLSLRKGQRDWPW